MDLDGSLHVNVIRASNPGITLFRGFAMLTFKGIKHQTSVKEAAREVQWNEMFSFPTKFKFTAAAALHLDIPLQVTLCTALGDITESKEIALPDLSPGKKQGIDVLLPSGAVVYLEVRLLMGDVSTAVPSRSRRTSAAMKLLSSESPHLRLSPSLPAQPIQSSASFHRAVNDRLSPTPPPGNESPRPASPRYDALASIHVPTLPAFSEVTPTRLIDSMSSTTFGDTITSSSMESPHPKSTWEKEPPWKRIEEFNTMPSPSTHQPTPLADYPTPSPRPMAVAEPLTSSPALWTSLLPERPTSSPRPVAMTDVPPSPPVMQTTAVKEPSPLPSTLPSTDSTPVPKPPSPLLTTSVSQDMPEGGPKTTEQLPTASAIPTLEAKEEVTSSSTLFSTSSSSSPHVQVDGTKPTPTPEQEVEVKTVPSLQSARLENTLSNDIAATVPTLPDLDTIPRSQGRPIKDTDSPSSLSVQPSEPISPLTLSKDMESFRTQPSTIPSEQPLFPPSVVIPKEISTHTSPRHITEGLNRSELSSTPQPSTTPLPSLVLGPKSPTRSPLYSQVSTATPSGIDFSTGHGALFTPPTKISEFGSSLSPLSTPRKNYEVTQVVEIHSYASPMRTVEESVTREEYHKRTSSRPTSSLSGPSDFDTIRTPEPSNMNDIRRMELLHGMSSSPVVSLNSGDSAPRSRHTISTLMSLLSTMTQQQVWDLCFYILRQETEVSSKEAYVWASQFLQSFNDLCGDQQQFDLWMSLITVVLSRMRLALRQAQSKLVAMEGESSKYAILHEQFKKDAERMREQVSVLERQLQLASESLEHDIQLEKLRADALEHELRVLKQRPTADALDALKSQLNAERNRVEHLETRLRSMQEQHDSLTETLRAELARERTRSEHLLGRLSSMEVGKEEGYATLQAAYNKERARTEVLESQLRSLETVRTDMINERKRAEHLEHQIRVLQVTESEALDKLRKDMLNDRLQAEQELAAEQRMVEQLRIHIRDLEFRQQQSPPPDPDVHMLRLSLEMETRRNHELHERLEQMVQQSHDMEERYSRRIQELERELQERSRTPVLLPQFDNHYRPRSRSESRAEGAYVAAHRCFLANCPLCHPSRADYHYYGKTL